MTPGNLNNTPNKNWWHRADDTASFNGINGYIARMDGYTAVTSSKTCKETKLEEAKKNMKTEKMLNISLILNAVLSLSVILLSITIFAIMVYGTIGIYG